jgi:hypothetical protein
LLDPNLCHLDFEGEGAVGVGEEGLAQFQFHLGCLVHLQQWGPRGRGQHLGSLFL